MEFESGDDVFYLYIENRCDKAIVKLQRDYYWDVEYIDGVQFDLGTLFSHFEIDEVVDSLRKKFYNVEIIDFDDIDEIKIN